MVRLEAVAQHGVRLAGAGLAVGKDARVVTIHAVVHHGPPDHCTTQWRTIKAWTTLQLMRIFAAGSSLSLLSDETNEPQVCRPGLAKVRPDVHSVIPSN